MPFYFANAFELVSKQSFEVNAHNEILSFRDFRSSLQREGCRVTEGFVAFFSDIQEQPNDVKEKDAYFFRPKESLFDRRLMFFDHRGRKYFQEREITRLRDILSLLSQKLLGSDVRANLFLVPDMLGNLRIISIEELHKCHGMSFGSPEIICTPEDLMISLISPTRLETWTKQS